MNNSCVYQDNRAFNGICRGTWITGTCPRKKNPIYINILRNIGGTKSETSACDMNPWNRETARAISKKKNQNNVRPEIEMTLDMYVWVLYLYHESILKFGNKNHYYDSVGAGAGRDKNVWEFTTRNPISHEVADSQQLRYTQTTTCMYHRDSK